MEESDIAFSQVFFSDNNSLVTETGVNPQLFMFVEDVSPSLGDFCHSTATAERFRLLFPSRSTIVFFLKCGRIRAVGRISGSEFLYADTDHTDVQERDKFRIRVPTQRQSTSKLKWNSSEIHTIYKFLCEVTSPMKQRYPNNCPFR